MALLSKKETDGDHEMATDFHFPTSKRALLIFTRNPELGKCKTRLAATIGDENALEVYKYLLKHTAQICSEVQADRYVFYSDKIIKDDVWDNSVFRKKIQNGADLGEKMANAFNDIFQMGYQKVIIIGSDLLDLQADSITNAFLNLDTNDVIIGPALDGGYYLLGMKLMNSNLFKNKKWSTDSVLKDTLSDLESSNVLLLKELNDIDTFEDLKPYDQLTKFYKHE